MDMIVQNVAEDGIADISFTVFRDDLPTTLKAVEEAAARAGRRAATATTTTCRRSRSSGMGMATQPGVAEQMFRALAEKGINILMITTSEIKISVLVGREHAQEALRTVHEAFQLDREPPAPPPAAGPGVKTLAGRGRGRRGRPAAKAWRT